MRRWALAAVVVGMAVAAAAIAVARVPTNPSAARKLDRSMFARLQTPPGASAETSDPSGGALRTPGARPVTPNLVDLRRFWRVPGDPADVLSWIEAHPPVGSKPTLTTGGTTTQSAGFSFLTPSWTSPAPSETLLITVAAARGGGTALRADAQVVWLLERSAAERIPPEVEAVTVSEARLGGAERGPWTVTAPARVGAVVALIDRLPAGQPGTRACPNDFGPYVTLAFLSRSGAELATAVVDGSGCLGVSLSIHGRQQHALQGNPPLVKRLSTALAIRL